MVIRESIALLVFEEDAGYMACSEGIVVAVAGQLATVQTLEMMFLVVDLLKQGETTHALVADLAVLYWIVVANHIQVE